MSATKAGQAKRVTCPLSQKYAESRGMYEAGLSIQQVAEFYGVTRQAMFDILRRRGTQMRPKPSGSDNHFFRGTKASDRAQNTLEKAVQRGIVVRKTHCETCGSVPPPKRNGSSSIEAHHPDYNKPLDVMWLCQKCHHEWHKTNRAIPRREGR